MNYTSKFAGIFEENDEGNYVLSDVALVDYDLKSDEYEVESGMFVGDTNEDFNLITTEPDSFFTYATEVDLSDFSLETNRLIILFENDYIDDVRINAGLQNELETFTYLAAKLGEMELHFNLDGSLYTKKLDNPKHFSMKEIEDSLYNNTNSNEIKPIDNPFDTFEQKEMDNANPFSFFVGSLLGVKPSSLKFVPANKKSFEAEPENEMYEEMFNEIEEIKKKYEKKREEQRIKSRNMNTKKVISETSSKIVGQEQVIKTLVNQIYNNQRIIEDIEKNGEFDITELDARKTTILLDGETGTGKTAILKDIARQLGLPIAIASSTNFSGTGYVGASVTDLLEDLLNQAEGDLEKAERGIIVFDEIDKLAFNKDAYIGKDMCEEVQHELLTFIGGGEYDVSTGGFPFGQKIKFNTSKNTFILSGAFTDLREDKIKEVDKSHQSMGFSTISSSDYDKEYVVTPDDYIKYGLMREFFGRIKVLASTKSYNLEDCKNILTKSIISPLLNFEKTVRMYGYPGIQYSEEFLNKVAEEGMKMKTGARGLQTVMSGIQNNMLDGLINKEFDEGKPIKLTTEMIEDYKKTFVRKY